MEARDAVRDALKNAIGLPKPPIDSLFDDVYANAPEHIERQREELRQHLQKYPEEYGLDGF